jgi:hypothetical protein
MNILNNKYHIVRYGDFATNGNAKLFYSIFAGTLCFDDYRTRGSIDCIAITTGATMVWTAVEIYLHTSGTRVIKPMFLGLRNNPNMQILLPTAAGALLQGAQEGGVVTAVGLYYGDRIRNLTILARLHLFIAVIVFNVWMRDTRMVTNVVASKRQVNTTGSMLLIGAATAYDLTMLWKHPEHAYRQLAMLSVMIYVCAWWTFVAWYRGFRSVEVHVKRDTRENTEQEYIVKPSTTINLIAVLGYDVLFEVGAAYLVFYNLFII